MRKVAALSVCVVFGLSACGGTTTPVTTDDGFTAQAQRAAAQYDRISSLALTAPKSMPASGTATFGGPAGISITRGLTSIDPDYVILGDAAMTANFGSGSMNGRISNLRGTAQIGNNSALLNDVTGQITFGGRSSIGDNPATGNTEADNAWSSTFKADMVIDGQTLTSNGLASGRFVGNRVGTAAAFPMKGIVGDGVGLGTLSGAPARIGIEMAGEN